MFFCFDSIVVSKYLIFPSPSRTIVCLIYCIDGKKAGFQLTLIVS